jgi:hypothetical protein
MQMIPLKYLLKFEEAITVTGKTHRIFYAGMLTNTP